MIEKILIVAWFVVVIPGGVLVACNAWALADRIFVLFAKYAIGGVEKATPTTLRIIAAGMVGIAILGIPVILLGRSQPQ